MAEISEEKIYYSIAEAAAITRVPKYVIRFWESRFPEIRPDRKTGRRYFRQSDIDAITRIRDLLYKHGFTIKGAKKAMKSRDAEGEKEPELSISLEKTILDAPAAAPGPDDRRILARYPLSGEPRSVEARPEKSELDAAPILSRLKAIKDILAA
jgi:DNA-binding transcriptional MerR regulator